MALSFASSVAGSNDGGLLLRAAEALSTAYGAEAEIEPLGSAPSETCMDAAAAVVVGVQPLSLPAEGRVAALVSLRCADGRTQTHPLWFSLRLPQLTWVARRNLHSGAVLQQDDFEQQRVLLPAGDDRNVAQFPAEPRELIRPLRAGSRLGPGDYRAIPLVRTGKPVLAHLPLRRVDMRLNAVALSDGEAGGLVRVRRLSGGSSFWARVTGRDAVELLP